MKTAVIYARYSSDSQTEQSIEGQLRVCKEYAEKNNIVILNTYIDRAMTGTNDNRPDFQRMLKDSNKKEWNYVLVYKLDRFSRNKYETTIHKHELLQNGIKVISAMENIPDSPEGIILESLLEGMNQYYSAELAQKVKRGMNETRQKGNFTGGNIIYGYKVVNHKVVIDEEEAEVVKYIYKQYSLGVFVTEIITTLKEKHIYKNNKPFARNTVYNILKNEKYSGIYRFKDEVFDNIYPQIIPTEIYEKVKIKTSQNRYGKHCPEVVYLLKNKLTCGYCGSPISAECGTTKNGVIKRYYKCLGRKRNNGCTKQNIRKEILEDFIVSIIVNKLNETEFVNKIVDSVYEIQKQLSNESAILKSLLKEKEQTQKSLNNIMTAIECGIMNNTTNKRMNELETKLEELEKQIIIESCKKSVQLTKKQLYEYYTEALKNEPKLLINYLIDQIYVFDNKVQIKFNNPTQRSPENNQGFLLFSQTLQIQKIIQNKNQPLMVDMKVEIYV